jgi:hypothetical protein
MSRAALLSVALPPGVRPSAESTEMLIKKFLKECSKDSLVHYLFENSAMSRRFTKKSIKMRQKRLSRLRNSKRYQQEVDKDFLDDKKKKKKKYEQKPKNNQE